MRTLVTIRKIKNIEPIQDADSIEKATVDGWAVVVKKNEFQIGDRVLYFEVDSFLPEIPQFEFLRKNCFRKMEDGSTGFRLRTIKLRGQVSQGLILPLTEFNLDYENTADLTTALGVKKWEEPIPACLHGKMKEGFPSFIIKTDQERIQNFDMNIIKQLTCEFELSEKVDGTSTTIYFNNGEFGVCGRNIEYLESDDNTYWQIVKKYDLENKLKTLNRNLAIQGEIIGPSIQGNFYKLLQREMLVFDIFDIDAFNYLEPEERQNIIKKLGLTSVPIFSKKQISTLKVEDFLYLADGNSILNPKVIREGLVFKACQKQRVSFKAVSNSYLLKYGG